MKQQNDFSSLRQSEKNSILEKLLFEKAQEADRVISRVLGITAALYFALWLAFTAGIVHTNKYMADIFILGDALLMGGFAFFLSRNRTPKRWPKYVVLFLFEFTVLGINAATGYKVWMLFAAPLILVCRYYSIRLLVFGGILSSLLSFICSFLNAYFSPFYGISDLNCIYYPEEILTGFSGYFHSIVTAFPVDSKEVLYRSLILSGVPNCLMSLCIMTLCIFLVSHGRELFYEAEARAKEEAELKLALADSRSKITLSQIQPHFLYNTLSAIMAIDGNPDETVEALGEFGKYLRENLSTLSASDMIPFSKEIQHVMRYISLEQLRFKDRLQVSYEVGPVGFLIPTLTVQMLAENAVKHGLTARAEGGCLTIRTEEDESEYRVIVEDNGVGFDPAALPEETSPIPGEHVGLYNLRTRLKTLCGGHLELRSSPGEGTTASVHIPKKGAGTV